MSFYKAKYCKICKKEITNNYYINYIINETNGFYPVNDSNLNYYCSKECMVIDKL